ncbi:MAG: AEC family transporter, partial [Magnetovibrio sp.]|nr:AEC family transporter [Magnetovibrio sp.]
PQPVRLSQAPIRQPTMIGEVLDILGRAALPLGLMAVGAGLNLRALRLAGGPAAGAVAVKLVVMPFLASIVCGVFGVTGVAASVAVLFAALPVSATSYVMARQLGGDGELMAAIVALSTLAAIATLPVIVSVYGS